MEFDLASGTEGRSVDLFGTPIAVANGFGSVWALDSFGTLTRLAPSSAEVEAEIEVGSSAPYNIWMGAGSVWVADDAGGEVIRVDPVSNDVVARIPVGDGPASMAFSGGQAWVANHRDRGITLVDTETNEATPLVRMKAGAPERLALLGGRLWVTGRGIGLFGLDPRTGTVEKQVALDVSGIDLVAADGALWIPSRSRRRPVRPSDDGRASPGLAERDDDGRRRAVRPARRPRPRRGRRCRLDRGHDEGRPLPRADGLVRRPVGDAAGLRRHLGAARTVGADHVERVARDQQVLAVG